MIRVSNVKASRVLPKICSSAQGPSTEAFGTKGGELEHACWKNGIFTLYSCSSVGVVAVFFFYQVRMPLLSCSCEQTFHETISDPND